MPKDWESWLDQQIREAQERGAFDNLPGKGKPLDLRSNPYAQDRELAFKVLKDAGYAPEWLERDKAIRKKVEAARVALARSRAWHAGRLEELVGRAGSWAEAERRRIETTWQQAITRFAADVADINREIAELNLQVPGPRFQRKVMDLARELAAIEGKASLS